MDRDVHRKGTVNGSDTDERPVLPTLSGEGQAGCLRAGHGRSRCETPEPPPLHPATPGHTLTPQSYWHTPKVTLSDSVAITLCRITKGQRQ